MQSLKPFRPFKPASEQPSIATLQMWFDSGFELWVTDKFDGIRGVNLQEGMMSAQMKPIPNRFVQQMAKEYIPMNFDGELLVAGSYHDVESAIMSRDGEPSFHFHVFDDCTYAHETYAKRIERIEHWQHTMSDFQRLFIHVELPRIVRSMQELMEQEQLAIDRGREGLIMRVPWGPYKYGRSTVNEAYGLKLKRWLDDEATIIAVNPLMHNDNPALINELGLQGRGQGIDGKVAWEMVGSYTVEHPKFGIFNVGTPLTRQERIDRWATRYHDIGEPLTFQYIPYGTQARPRHPKIKFIGRRDL